MMTMVGQFETLVRPVVEGSNRKVCCVLGINGDYWIVRVDAPDGKGGRRIGYRRHATEAQAVADYDTLVAKMGGQIGQVE